jgi:SAM-dependent methyltransferase
MAAFPGVYNVMLSTSQASTDADPFYGDAQRYDLIAGKLSGNGPVAFYRRQARLCGGPVLELACGSGRVALPIAEDGIEVVGLDSSPAMLALAERKAKTAGLTVDWILDDMRSFALQRQFAGIFVASNSFFHLYSIRDLESCFGSIRRHLRASGRLVIDVFNPALKMFVQSADQRFPIVDYHDPENGHQVQVSKTIRYDSSTQIAHELWHFHDQATGTELSIPLNLRMFFPQELDALLRYNGFRIEEKYGSLDGASFSNWSLKQVIICAGAD